MARVLASGGIYDSLLAVLAVGTDDKIGVWTEPGASTCLKRTVDGGSGLTLTGTMPSVSSGYFNGNPVPIMSVTADAALALDSPIACSSSGITIYAACTDMDLPNWGYGFLVMDSGSNTIFRIVEATQYLEFSTSALAYSSDPNAIPIDGTDFGIAVSHRPYVNPTDGQVKLLYGAAGSSLGEIYSNTAVTNVPYMSDIYALLGSPALTKFWRGQLVLLAVFAGVHTAAQIADLHGSPYGTLFPSVGGSPAPFTARSGGGFINMSGNLKE